MTPSSTPDNPAAIPVRGTMPDDMNAASATIARRLAAGATMWCFAPALPGHDDDIAAEFVRPVGASGRRIRVAAVGGSDLVAQLREKARSGDLLLVISAGDQAEVAATMRRAPVWGLSTIWIGAGERPEPGAADHVLWVDPDPDSHPDKVDEEGHPEDLVALWYELSGLTRTWLEDRSVLDADAPADDPKACSVDGVCVTCSDEGQLGEIVTVGVAGDVGRSAVARTAGGLEEIDASLVGDLVPGDLVVIHAGSAIGLVEPTGDSTREVGGTGGGAAVGTSG